jgi:hypothetical protein
MLFMTFLEVIVVIAGQIFYTKTNGNKNFFIVHIIGLVIIYLIVIATTSNQSGGVDWPWWLIGTIYSISVFISLVIGIIRKLLSFN